MVRINEAVRSWLDREGNVGKSVFIDLGNRKEVRWEKNIYHSIQEWNTESDILCFEL